MIAAKVDNMPKCPQCSSSKAVNKSIQFKNNYYCSTCSIPICGDCRSRIMIGTSNCDTCGSKRESLPENEYEEDWSNERWINGYVSSRLSPKEFEPKSWPKELTVIGKDSGIHERK